MELPRNVHGHDWGDLFFRSGGLQPGDTIYRVIAAWLTWRQIPIPEWLQPVVERAKEPPLRRPQPGTYGNAAAARAARNVEAPAHYWSRSSTPSHPGESDPDTLPLQDQHPGYLSSSSKSIWTHPRPRSTAGARGALEPSRADPPSPWQERAAN